MERQYEISPSAKLLELWSRFREAHEKDTKARPGTIDNFESVVMGIFSECFDVVKKREPGKLPALRVEFLSQNQFDTLCSSLRISSGSSYAFIEHVRGIIAINVQALMAKGFDRFVPNLVITFFEELFHAANPDLGEIAVKKLAYEATENYLGIPIPPEYKEASYERAIDPSYGK